MIWYERAGRLRKLFVFFKRAGESRRMERTTKNAESQAFWDSVRRSAELVQGLPAWTQAGIVLSENFEGSAARSRDIKPSVHKAAKSRKR